MNKPLSIGFGGRTVSSTYNKGLPDGIGVYTNQLSKALSQLHQKISFFSTIDNVNSDIFYFNEERFKFPYELNFLMQCFLENTYLETPQVDIFHFTDYRSFGMKCPVVSTLYDAIPLKSPELSNSKFRKLKNKILKKSAQFADKVIAISDYSVQELVEYYEVPESKISVVLCGIENHWMDFIAESEWKITLIRRGLKTGYFLFVGLIQPRKNLMRLLLAHDLLPKDIRNEKPLVVVGRQGWSSEDTVNLLNKKILKGEAFWFDDVYTQTELKHLYKGAGVFVYPSLYEGFGLPILEAFASGIPVMTSNVTSLPEISNGIGLEINPNDEFAMSNAMLSLLEPSERSSRIPAGLERAKDLTWEKTALNTLKVYHSLL